MRISDLTRVPLAVSLVLAAASSAALPASQAPAAVVRHVTDSAASTVGAASVVAGRQYAFSSVVAGKPVRWNPCAPIHWRVSKGAAPAGGFRVLRHAVDTVAAATGTTWVYDGLSTRTPGTSALPREASQSAPVLLGWSDGSRSDLLAGKPWSTLGITRTTWFGVRSGTTAVAATRGAVVALDRRHRLPLHGAVSWDAVVLHELGHVMGLAHAPDTRQLMAARLSGSSSGRLAAGDRTGLALLGRGQGCVSLPIG